MSTPRSPGLVVLAVGISLLPGLVAAQPGLEAVTMVPGEDGGATYTVSIQVLAIMTALTLLPAALIMMTAFTTICGMVPVTLSGASSIGLSYTSFGLTLIGGLTTATLLTLLVVPVFYTFFDDAQLVTGRALRSALGATPRAGTVEP